MGSSLAEIEAEHFNLCHVQGYATSMNATTQDGEVFNTQVKENIFSATRALNENMLRFEKVILSLVNEKEVKSIIYTTKHAPFSNSHVLASIKINVEIQMKDGSRINFDYEFNIADNRKLPLDLEKQLEIFIKAKIQKVEPPLFFGCVGEKRKRKSSVAEEDPILKSTCHKS
jgi:hypothetical protein